MLTRKVLFLAKIEAEYGTDPVPTAAANAVLVMDPVIKPVGEMLERRYPRAKLSPLTPALGAKHVEITFSTELKGSGAAGTAPEVGPLLRACGLGETIVASTSVAYTPISEDFESCTIYANIDGVLHKICGCRGTVSFDLSAGQYGKFNFTMRGLYQSPVDVALEDGTYNATLPPMIESLGLTLGTYEPGVIQQLQLALNNNLVTQKSVNAAEAVSEMVITDRKTAGSFNPNAVLEATNPFWGDWEDRTELALTATLGATAGNIITIAAPKVSYDSLAWGDRDGDRIYDIPMTLAGDSGDDELVITFT